VARDGRRTRCHIGHALPHNAKPRDIKRGRIVVFRLLRGMRQRRNGFGRGRIFLGGFGRWLWFHKPYEVPLSCHIARNGVSQTGEYLMAIRPSLRAFSLLAGLFLLAAPQTGRAQNAGDVGKPVVRVFSLKNARPSLVAGWFDRERTPRNWLDVYTSFREQPFPALLPPPVSLPGNVNGPNGLRFPAGVSSLVAIDAQGGLYATGTKEGLDALAKLLPALDVPLTQVEIETRFLRVNRADFSALALKSREDRAENAGESEGAAILAAPVDFETRLQKMIDPKRVQVLAAPRITVTDGGVGQLVQSVSTPALLAQANPKNPKDEDIAYLRSSIAISARVGRVSRTSCRFILETKYQEHFMDVEATLREHQPLVTRLWSENGQSFLTFTTFTFVRRVGQAPAAALPISWSLPATR